MLRLRLTQTAIGLPRIGTAAWSRQDTIILVSLMLCAWSLYFWRLGQPQSYIYDEVYHAYTAAQLASGNTYAYLWYTEVPEKDRGLRVDYEWVHPALAKLPMQLGVLLFGDDSFGWRIASAVFGGIGIGVLSVLGRLFFGRIIGLLASVLLLFDGLWLVQSRTAMNDVFLVCFLMLAYMSFYLYLSKPELERRFLWLTGVALGLAVATKWSALYSLGLMGLITAVREAWLYLKGHTRQPLQRLMILAGVFIAVPAALYLGGYVQFFLMGHTLSEWRELQWQIWRYHSNLRACHDWSSPGWTWPFMLRPVWYYTNRYPDASVANVFAMGNPLIWWAFLPAIGVVAVQWVRGRFQAVGLGLILLGFLGQWLPWFLSPRIAYLYHLLPSVPFGCLAVAYGLGLLRKEWLLIAVYLTLVVLAFVFFYSQWTALPVTAEYTKLHYWLPTWEPGSQWPLRCPAP